ncbi:MAG: fused MFS/spermidine synthase [Gammaproteobacteria bacterium]
MAELAMHVAAPATGASSPAKPYALGFLALAVVLELVAMTGMCDSNLVVLWRLATEWTETGSAALGIAMAPFIVMFVGASRQRHAVLGCVAAGAALTTALFATNPAAAWGWQSLTLNTVFGGAVACLAYLGFRAREDSGADGVFARHLLWSMAIILMYGLSARQLLQLTAQLRPLTYDESVYLLDAAYGFIASRDVALWAGAHPWIETLLSSTYIWINAAVVLLYGLQQRRRERAPINVLDVMLLSGVAGMVAYHLYPITGPQFAFAGSFPDALPALEELRTGMTLTVPAARNGMPSLHFGWAFALAFIALYERGWVRLLFGVFAVLTAISTLSTGHHYLVDLVVACPFMLAMLALASRALPFDGVRRQCVVLGGVLYAAWLVALWSAIPLMIDLPLVLWAATLATLAASALGFRRLYLANRDAGPRAQAFTAAPRSVTALRADTRLIHGLFFVSGAAALVYQVLFSKQLTYVFGSMSTATNSVLATYMAGLAIGAWLGGIIAPRTTRPVALYAFIEFAIAGYCAASPQIFSAVQAVYVAFAAGLTPDAQSLLYLRFGLGALCLIVPTVLMGLTLPLLARFFEQRRESLGISVGGLYASNTLGAGLGALAAGYFILPTFGMHRTTLLAVLANLFVAALALELHKRIGQAATGTAPAPAPAQTSTPAARRAGMAALLVLVVGGFVTLALEVNFIHLLAVAAGNSTYAFSLMLFSFLIGLGAGAEVCRQVMARFDRLRLLAWLEVTLCVTILLSFRHINALAEYFAVFAHYPVYHGWGAREVIRGLVCCVAMIPPAFLIGAIFPVAIDCVGRGFADRPIRMLGVASALNTVGNIAGVLVAGFILLPLLGSERALSVMAGLTLAMGAFAITLSQRRRDPAFWGYAGVALVLLVRHPASLDYDVLTSGANVYFGAQRWGEVIDHAESLDGGLTSVNRAVGPDGEAILTLLTNGKFQGNDADSGEVVAQMGFALAPLLHNARRDAALVIGYGTGNTSKVLHDAGFGRLDVVDLSADIFRLANEHFESINGRVTERDGVTPFVTDGRNYLLLTEQRYDLISMEISSIWFAGAASLYSSDYYDLARARLKDGGVLQQWMQLHHASPIDLYYVLGSMRQAFDYVWVYLIGQQGIVVASNDPHAVPSAEHVAALRDSAALSNVASDYGGCLGSVGHELLLDPAGTDAFLGSLGVPADYFDSNDDNAFLEYNTPKGNALDGRRSFVDNASMLGRFSGPSVARYRAAAVAGCANR